MSSSPHPDWQPTLLKGELWIGPVCLGPKVLIKQATGRQEKVFANLGYCSAIFAIFCLLVRMSTFPTLQADPYHLEGTGDPVLQLLGMDAPQ